MKNHISIVHLNRYLGFDYSNKKKVIEAFEKFNCNPRSISNHRTKITVCGYKEYNKKKIFSVKFNFEMKDLYEDIQFKYSPLDLVSDGNLFYLICELPDLGKRVNRFLVYDEIKDFGNRYHAIPINKDLSSIPENMFYPKDIPVYCDDDNFYLAKHLTNEEASTIYLKIESNIKSSKIDQLFKYIHNENNDIDILPILDLGEGVGKVQIKSYFFEHDIPHLHIDSINGKFHTCICLLIPKYFSHGDRFNQELTQNQLSIIDNFLRQKLPKNYYAEKFDSAWDWLVDRWAIWNQSICQIPRMIKFNQPDYTKTNGWIL